MPNNAVLKECATKHRPIPVLAPKHQIDSVAAKEVEDPKLKTRNINADEVETNPDMQEHPSKE